MYEPGRKTRGPQRQLEEQHCLGHVVAQERMRHVYLPGPAVSRESTSKRKAECDGKSSEGAQRENTVTVPWHTRSRQEKHAAAINSLMSKSKKKRVNAEANEAKRSRGNCFVARHLDEGTPAPET